MEKTIVMSATIASSVCFVAIIVLLVVRAKRNGTYRGKKLAAKIGTVFLSLFLAVMVVCNFVVYRFSNVINQYFSTIDLDDPDVQEVRNAGLELTEEIEDEGIVLLKMRMIHFLCQRKRSMSLDTHLLISILEEPAPAEQRIQPIFLFIRV